MSLVDLREVGPPVGVTPLHWRLLTTCRDQHGGGLGGGVLYRGRWAIGRPFRTPQTKGFDIEDVPIGRPHRAPADRRGA